MLHLMWRLCLENKIPTIGIRGWATVLTATCTRVVTERRGKPHSTVAMSAAVAYTIPIAVLRTYSSTSLLSQRAHSHTLLIYAQLKLPALKVYLSSHKSTRLILGRHVNMCDVAAGCSEASWTMPSVVILANFLQITAVLKNVAQSWHSLVSMSDRDSLHTIYILKCDTNISEVM
jgi:hypothetical protein